ncbi:hypothetical protein HMPREF0262_03417 [Clostridium sp. ATCC 29733]|nr:hypothetical protein HMPREF0262_03417 [Clostridium sp. ATCC 29733]
MCREAANRSPVDGGPAGWYTCEKSAGGPSAAGKKREERAR